MNGIDTCILNIKQMNDTFLQLKLSGKDFDIEKKAIIFDLSYVFYKIKFV